MTPVVAKAHARHARTIMSLAVRKRWCCFLNSSAACWNSCSTGIWMRKDSAGQVPEVATQCNTRDHKRVAWLEACNSLHSIEIPNGQPTGNPRASDLSASTAL